MSLSFVLQAAKRFNSIPLSGSMSYALGRSLNVRRAYGQFMSGLQYIGAVPKVDKKATTLFTGLDLEKAKTELQENSLFPGLQIPEKELAGILDYINNGVLIHWKTGREFVFDDVKDGRFADGNPAILADVKDMDMCVEARRIAHDPFILDTIKEHMGYAPVKVDIRVLVSFATDVSDETRRFYGQTYKYHFDVHGYNFVYSNFYLTDVDASTGAHVTVLGSHRDKPLHWLMGSANRSDEEIHNQYDASKIQVIEGKAGSGFIEDTSCYHKAIPPQKDTRIMLHLRYY